LSVLTPEAEAFIIQYMNLSQPESNLAIVKVHGGMNDAVTASLTALNETHALFCVDESIPCEVQWPRPLKRREDVREFLFELYESALDEIADTVEGRIHRT
jgi:hypothetical protein